MVQNHGLLVAPCTWAPDPEREQVEAGFADNPNMIQKSMSIVFLNTNYTCFAGDIRFYLSSATHDESSPHNPPVSSKALKLHSAMRRVLEVTYCSVPEIKDLMLAVMGIATIETQMHVIQHMGMCL